MGELVDKKISVSIDGQRLFSFKSLKLHQPINEHHRFELLIDLETGGNRYVHNLKDSAEWQEDINPYEKAFPRSCHQCKSAP